MHKSEKETQVAEIRGRFERMSSAVFVDFTGMTVQDVTQLRNTFRAKGIEYKVVKNTLVQQALHGRPWLSGLDAVLVGMTGVAWSYEEPSAAARILKEFCKTNEKLKVKAGVLDDQVLGAAAVQEQLALLPNKDEARAMLLATMLAPAQTMVRLLNAPAQQLVGVLDAKKRKEAGA